MTGTNHVLTGANIALVTGQWWAVPVAVASHFMLDMLPHFGEDNRSDRLFRIMFAIDALFMIMLAVAIAGAGLMSALVFACMLAAWSPDWVWLWREYRERKGLQATNAPMNVITRLHKQLQWGERRWGWVLEIAWFIAMLSVMALAINDM